MGFGRGVSGEFGEGLSEAAARFVADANLGRDYFFTALKLFDGHSHFFGPGIFAKGHSKAFFELASDRGFVDVEGFEILSRPFFFRVFLDGFNQGADDVGSGVGIGCGGAAFASTISGRFSVSCGFEKFAVFEFGFFGGAAGTTKNASGFDAGEEEAIVFGISV